MATNKEQLELEKQKLEFEKEKFEYQKQQDQNNQVKSSNTNNNSLKTAKLLMLINLILDIVAGSIILVVFILLATVLPTGDWTINGKPATQDDINLIKVILLTICWIGFLPLAWMVPIYLGAKKAYKNGGEHIALAICEIIFCGILGIISGILTLISNNNNTNQENN